MSYTVNKLAKLSGVSIRTLHYYDEIGLLKPSSYGDNKYRYYEEEQLLLLQQILFFRELGFQLSDIQKMMSSDDFDKLKTLMKHRKSLEQTIEHTNVLIQTIDKTISHLQGKTKMTEEEMYQGFSKAKQKEYEKYLIDSGKVSQQLLDQGKESVKHWKKEEWDKFHREGDEINKALLAKLQNNIDPAAADVQVIIQRHYNWVKLCWTPNQESYMGLSQLYADHADFRKYYDAYHPEFVEYIAEAMQVFAARELSNEQK